MSKSTSISVAEIENSKGQKPEGEARGIRIVFKPVKFQASVKKDGTFKTIALQNIRLSIDTAEMAAQTGFPIGSVIAGNAYLPVKRANKEQMARAVSNWRAAQKAKAEGGSASASIDDYTADDSDNIDDDAE